MKLAGGYSLIIKYNIIKNIIKIKSYMCSKATHVYTSLLQGSNTLFEKELLARE